MSDAALRLSGIACARGGRLLFRGVDLALERGGSALLRGPNGVGKSSLMRICAGLLRPVAGTIERRGRIALADERLALDMEDRLQTALGFWARLDGADTAALDRAMDAMALGPIRDIPVRMLSTGQRKRASLARVIAGGAPIWLLDEPGNGLDDASLALLGAAVEAHLATGGIVVAASHQPLPVAAPVTIALADYLAEDAG
ncbi:Heme exporter protein CcmA [Sphingobium herbicidovorans NBRC 16415]|uniref:Heme exporter protein CcmA n=1 Tax=Sphingobium herbicidovorans (strain ATCC 700291 / DSM 11019 / CCUG 56400 / KCTC 2939 / LMG 18315 / NBRC 16415 / MH) TaxID=1219045 RepID=A0A086PDX1_SPHHM|nr:heme ABC exporter ATP-binding protein CcmA [Sphingobium herbicidovorans]KFG91589.1 Heme exporter protein CcmA [Sphingobium herbicidovorans NBRC 16415]